MGGSRQSPLTTHRIGIVWYEFHTRHCANVSIVWWNANNCCFDKAISNVSFGFIIVVILLRTGTTIGRNGFRTIICNTWYISAILIWITWDAQLQFDAKVICILKVGVSHYYTLWKDIFVTSDERGKRRVSHQNNFYMNTENSKCPPWVCSSAIWEVCLRRLCHNSITPSVYLTWDGNRGHVAITRISNITKTHALCIS